MEIPKIYKPAIIQLFPYQGFNTLRFGDDYAIVRQKLPTIKPLDAEGHYFHLREYYEAMNMTLEYSIENKLNGITFLFETSTETDSYFTLSSCNLKFMCKNIEIHTLSIIKLVKIFKHIDKNFKYCQFANRRYLLFPILGLVFHEYEKSGIAECLELFPPESLEYYLKDVEICNNLLS